MVTTLNNNKYTYHTVYLHILHMTTKLLKVTSCTKHQYQYVEIKCQLDATEVFIADIIACSTCFGHDYAHHQELKSTFLHHEIPQAATTV